MGKKFKPVVKKKQCSFTCKLAGHLYCAYCGLVFMRHRACERRIKAGCPGAEPDFLE